MSKKTDQAITVIEYLLKKKQKRVEEYSRKSTTTENEKIFIGDETQLIANCRTLIQAIKDERNKNFGKIPPQATDLETAVLGAIILENKIEKVKSFLLPEHFYLQSNEIIYRTTLKLKVIDLSTIVIQLRHDGQLEAVGGAYYVAKLTEKVSSAAHVEFHARILVEMAIKRRLIMASGEILEEAYKDGSDCFEVLDIAEKQIQEIKTWIK